MNDDYTACGGGLLQCKPPETPEEIAEFKGFFVSHGMEPPKVIIVDA